MPGSSPSNIDRESEIICVIMKSQWPYMLTLFALTFYSEFKILVRNYYRPNTTMLDSPGLRPGLNKVEMLPVWATSADIVAVRRKPVWILRSFVPTKQPRLARIESANDNYTAAWTSIYQGVEDNYTLVEEDEEECVFEKNICWKFDLKGGNSGVTQFHKQFTYVSTQFWALNRKHEK